MTITLPDFESTLVRQTADGEFVSEAINLNKLVTESGQGLILYFYPKDSTSGCTVQAVDFSADLAQFSAKGYQIIGVSRDSVKSHQNFISKQALKIALISDADERLCQHFDVIKEKQMYGKTHLGVVRSTFVFDQSGVLMHELRNIKAKAHSEHLLSLL